jgi:hypothetical protein
LSNLYPISRGAPWWLYICSQLEFTSSSYLLLQVEVLGLAGFVYPSSGILPWQELGRPISRTEGSYPRHPPTSDLDLPLLSTAMHRMDRHPPGVEVPAIRKMEIAQAHRHLLLVLGRGRAGVGLAKRPAPCHVGRGSRRCLVLDAVGSISYKGGRDRSLPRSLMAAQSLKRRWSVRQRHCWWHRIRSGRAAFLGAGH